MKTIEEPDWQEVMPPEREWLPCIRTWFKENIEGKLIIDPDDLVEVVGQIKNINGKDYFCATQIANTGETHKALLIKSSIQAIEKDDSAEKIVRDLANCHHSAFNGDFNQLIERAKKLENS